MLKKPKQTNIVPMKHLSAANKTVKRYTDLESGEVRGTENRIRKFSHADGI